MIRSVPCLRGSGQLLRRGAVGDPDAKRNVPIDNEPALNFLIGLLVRAFERDQKAWTESIPLACRTTCIFSSADLWICETRLSLMPRIPPISFMVISLV
jgi:hypothetical protein